MSEISDVKRFMEAGGQTTTHFNPKQYSLYTALQLEELGEKLAAIGLHMEADFLDQLSSRFKIGHFTHLIQQADKGEMLDADIDSAWVSFGALLSLTSYPVGAWDEVVRSNMSKTNPATGKMDRDENGKIMKAATYTPPNLGQFV